MSIVRLMAILASIGTRRLTIASVLVWILTTIIHGGLGRQGVAPLVTGHHGVAILIILGLLTIRASIHWRSGPVRVHGASLTKVYRLRLPPCPPGRVRLLRRHLGMVGRVTSDVKWLRVHRIVRWLLLLSR